MECANKQCPQAERIAVLEIEHKHNTQLLQEIKAILTDFIEKADKTYAKQKTVETLQKDVEGLKDFRLKTITIAGGVAFVLTILGKYIDEFLRFIIK